MNVSAFRDLWAYGSFNFENFQDIRPTVGHFFFHLGLPQCFHDNFRIALYNRYLHSINYLCIRLWPIRISEICYVYIKDRNVLYREPTEFVYRAICDSKPEIKLTVKSSCRWFI